MRGIITGIVILAIGAVALAVAFKSMGRFIPDVTQAKYDQISTSMALNEVRNILGSDGYLTNSEAHYLFLGTGREPLYVWRQRQNRVWVNEDGSGIMLSFDGSGRLVDKNAPQLNLPGVTALKLEFDEGGNITNTQALERYFGKERFQQYLGFWRTIAQISPLDPMSPQEKESAARQALLYGRS